jgi:hypothetical protein
MKQVKKQIEEIPIAANAKLPREERNNNPQKGNAANYSGYVSGIIKGFCGALSDALGFDYCEIFGSCSAALFLRAQTDFFKHGHDILSSLFFILLDVVRGLSL